jgi:hypothetical protein
MLVYVGVLWFGLRCGGLVSGTLISKNSVEVISEESRNMLIFCLGSLGWITVCWSGSG